MKAVYAPQLWTVPCRVSKLPGSGSAPCPWPGALHMLLWTQRCTVRLSRAWSCVRTMWFSWGRSSWKHTAGLCARSKGLACRFDSWNAAALEHPAILHLAFCRQSYCCYTSASKFAVLARAVVGETSHRSVSKVALFFCNKLPLIRLGKSVACCPRLTQLINGRTRRKPQTVLIFRVAGRSRLYNSVGGS